MSSTLSAFDPLFGNLSGRSEREKGAVSELDELLRGALAYHTPESLRALMEFVCKLPRIAPYNAMLLHVQNPGISYVGSAREWRQIQRQVRPGSRPYMILKFMGPVKFVYDLADTEGPELSPEVQRFVQDPFSVEGQLDPLTWRVLLRMCQNLNITVIEKTFGPDHAGDVVRTREGYEVRLHDGHPLPARFTTLVHELGHLFYGHQGKRDTDFWSERDPLSLATRELEAESVAYLVAKRRGLRTASARYLSDYLLPGMPLPPLSLETILIAAGAVEELLRGKLPSKERNRRQRAAAKSK